MLNITRFEQLLEKIADNQLYTDFQPDSRFEDLLLKIAAKVDAGGSGGGSDGTIVTKVYDSDKPISPIESIDHINFNVKMTREEVAAWAKKGTAKYQSPYIFATGWGRIDEEIVLLMNTKGIDPSLDEGIIFAGASDQVDNAEDFSSYVVYASKDMELSIKGKSTKFTAGGHKSQLSFRPNQINGETLVGDGYPSSEIKLSYCQDLLPLIGNELQGISNGEIGYMQSSQLISLPNNDCLKIGDINDVSKRHDLSKETDSLINGNVKFFNFVLPLDIVEEKIKQLVANHGGQEVVLFTYNGTPYVKTDGRNISVYESNGKKIEDIGIKPYHGTGVPPCYYKLNDCDASRDLTEADYILLKDLIFGMSTPDAAQGPAYLPNHIEPNDIGVANKYQEFQSPLIGLKSISSNGNRLKTEEWTFKMADGTTVTRKVVIE